jgi:hypothetical protein
VSQYAKLDELILAVLKNGGARTFSALRVGAIRAECERLEAATGSEEFRILDRRLQALRKAGKIEYLGAKATEGWVLRGGQQ